jgi:hypothetical protein
VVSRFVVTRAIECINPELNAKVCLMCELQKSASMT